MVKQLTEEELSTAQAADTYGVTPPTVRKWLGRYLAGGEAALADASSRPKLSPRSIDARKALLIVELRKRRMIQSRIARSVGVSESTVSRVLCRAGLSKLSALDPVEPLVRYEHEAPGDLLHIDTKKLGCIVRPSHRVTGNRKDSTRGAGWETLFVAIDDHARVAFTAMHPDEKQEQAEQKSRCDPQGVDMATSEALRTLRAQNRLLKLCLLLMTALLCLAAAPARQRFQEIDVERLNVVTADGQRELVIANRDRLPGVVSQGQEAPDHRRSAGIIFYNSVGDESGGMVWSGRPGSQDQPEQSMHLAMDRFGGDQQVALGHYERAGHMMTGLRVFDRGLERDYEPFWKALNAAPPGEERESWRRKWEAAGGVPAERLFAGKTAGKSSALILSDGKGRPRLMMYVTEEGKAVLDFLDERGEVIKSLAPQAGSK